MFFSKSYSVYLIPLLALILIVWIHFEFFREAKVIHYYTNEDYQEVVNIISENEEEALNDSDLSYIYVRSLLKLGNFKDSLAFINKLDQEHEYDDQIEYLRRISIILNTCNYFIKQKGLLKTIRAQQIEPVINDNFGDILDFYRISNLARSSNQLFYHNRDIIITYTLMNSEFRFDLMGDLLMIDDTGLLNIVLGNIREDEISSFSDQLLYLYENNKSIDQSTILPLLKGITGFDFQSTIEEAIRDSIEDPSVLSQYIRSLEGVDYSFARKHIDVFIKHSNYQVKSSALILLRYYINDQNEAFLQLLSLLTKGNYDPVLYGLLRNIILNLEDTNKEKILDYWNVLHSDIKEVFAVNAVIKQDRSFIKFMDREEGLNWKLWKRLLYDKQVDQLEPGEREILLLISVDTLRRDHLELYGYPRDTMPNITQRTQESGIIFSNFYSNSSWTVPSHVSMLTGLSPLDHKVNGYHDRISEDMVYLPQVLKKNDYVNIAFTTHSFVSQNHNFHRSFDFFYFNQEENAQSIINKVISVLDHILSDKANSKSKIFVFIHLYDCHSPYTPEENFNIFTDKPPFFVQDNDFINDEQNLYNGEIFYVDHVLSGFIDKLGSDINNTVFIITSDHGEEFLEHNGVLHGTTLYREVVEVPFVVIAEKEKILVIEPYSDLFLSNRDTPYLVSKLSGGAINEGYFNLSHDFVELFLYRDRIRKYSFIEGYLKLKHNILDNSFMLYDLKNDRNETRSLDINDYPDHIRRARKRIEDYEDSGESLMLELEMTQEQLDSFRALGYIN